MELFKIFGTIAVNNQAANSAIDETTNKASSVSSAFQKIGGVAVKAGKVIATGLGVAASAIGVVAKQSLDSYADYEQLVGGVQTLFNETSLSLEDYAASVGKSVQDVADEWGDLTSGARFVMNNAEEAFRTAGLSANEYMETVTSFSASLLQSLGGDTDKAAEVADKAIIDMADNANKMGSTMESIQNAYQGFAKQNYTMLDNLKLGYGGTKEEMQRLLADAGKLAGQKFDISSYADIIEAIHVVQENMGIAGATAEEAATTISGSLAMTKAAWQNLLVGFADDSADVGVLITNLVTSGTTALENILPRISKIFGGISTFIAQAMPVIAAELPAMLEELLPGLVEGAVGLVNGLLIALPDIMAILLAQLPFIVTQISQGLIQAFPALLETVKLLFGQIWDWIAVELLGTEADFESSFGKIQQLFTFLWSVLQGTWETLGQPIWNAIQGCVSVVKEVFAEYMPEIRGFVSHCFDDIRMFWQQNLKPCFDAIGNFIETVLAPIFQVVFEARIRQIIETTFGYIKNIWEGTLKPVFTGITDFLTGVFTLDFEKAWQGIESIFKGIMNGIITGAETMVNSVINGINGLIEAINDISVVEAISEALGIDGIPTIPQLSLPRLAKGGILEKGQLGLLEGDGAEAVVPLDQNKKWISAVAQDMDAAVGGGGRELREMKEAFADFVDALPDMLVDAFASMKFDVNNREFARLVKAVN